MGFRERLRSEAGATLLELLVGSAVALIALGAIIRLLTGGYRAERLDQERYLAQSQASLAVEQIVRDVRSAGAATLTEEGSLVLASGGRSIIYSFDPAAQLVSRSVDGVERPLGGRTQQVLFAREPDGRTIRLEWTACLPGEATYRIVSRAVPRVAE